jgi:hypothetical protein
METYYSEAASDDAFWERNAADGIVYPGTSFYFGYTGTQYLDAFVRFRLPVRPGASIVYAALSFKNEDDQSALTAVTIHAVLDDDASAPETIDAARALPLSDGVAWEIVDWEAGVRYYSADISSLLRNIVNRPGWQEGNHVVLMIKGDNSQPTVRRVVSFDSELTDYHPALSVELAGASILFPSFAISASGRVSHVVGNATITWSQLTSTGQSNLAAFGLAELLAFEVVAHGGGVAEAAVPMLTVAATGHMTLHAFGRAELPAFEVTAYGGGVAECLFPAFAAEGFGGAQGLMRFSGWSVVATGTARPLVVGNMAFPGLRVEASGCVGTVAEGICRLSQWTCRGTGSINITGRGYMAFPRLSVCGGSGGTIFGYGEIKLPRFALVLGHAKSRPPWATDVLCFDPERLA